MSEITNPKVLNFLSTTNSSLLGLRSVLLFGKNTYTYKFALCEAITKIGPRSLITYDEILPPFIDAFLRHMKLRPIQYNSKSGGEFTEASKLFLTGNLSRTKLDDAARKNVHKYVFDAFQNIGGGSLKKDHLLFDYEKARKSITLRDPFLKVLSDPALLSTLEDENEARWRLVEEAWTQGISRALIQFDETNQNLFYEMGDLRISLRSALDSLLPYQKGLCFYCNRPINRFAKNGEENFPDVDHFIALSRLRTLQDINVNPNGIWNLVISCLTCNRGTKGKADRIPEKEYFEQLVVRNEYLAEEHAHGMKYGILTSLDLRINDSAMIRSKIQSIYNLFAAETEWSPAEVFQIA